MKPRHRLSSRLWGTFEANSITEVGERPRRSARAGRRTGHRAFILGT